MGRLLLAFDPGVHTGVAWFADAAPFKVETVVDDGTTDPYARLRFIIVGGESWPGGVRGAVCESFHTFRLADRAALETVKLIGWIEGTCRLYGVPLTYQAPPVRLPFREDARRLLAGDDIAGASGSDHERDALAHGLAFLAAAERLAARQAGRAR